MRKVVKGAAIGAVVVAAVPVGLALALRSGNRRVIDAIRSANRSLVNPVMLRTAGQEGSFMAVVHHRGRTTGIQYATPVIGVEGEGGYLIPLTYGTGVDWLQNLMAAESGSIEVDGEMHPVFAPSAVRIEDVSDQLTARVRTACRLFGVTELAQLEVAPLA